MTKKELLGSIDRKHLASYIATYYWEMSKEELKDIALQLFFTMYDNNLNESDIDIDELLERLNLDDEEQINRVTDESLMDETAII